MAKLSLATWLVTVAARPPRPPKPRRSRRLRPSFFPGPPAGVEAAGEVLWCRSTPWRGPGSLAGGEHAGVEGVEPLDPLHHRADVAVGRRASAAMSQRVSPGADDDDLGGLGRAGLARWRPSRRPRRRRSRAATTRRAPRNTTSAPAAGQPHLRAGRERGSTVTPARNRGWGDRHGAHRDLLGKWRSACRSVL